MLLREARGPRSMTEVAAASGVPAETLRKIETGRIATPAFFTVAALAAAVGLPALRPRTPPDGPLARSQRVSNARLRAASGWAPRIRAATELWGSLAG